jgi:hypothetical protein
MGRLIPLGSIPRTNILPTDVYRLKVNSFVSKMSKENEAENKKSKLMYVLTTSVVEPASHKGMPFTTNFVIGNEDDPEAEDLATWQKSYGGRQFAKFTDKIGVPFGDEEDEDVLCKQVENAEFLATIVEKTDDGKRDARRKGQVSNEITAFWAIGEKEPGSGNQPAGAPKASTTKGAAKAASQPKDAPSEEVTCTACKKRVKKSELKTHVDAHLAEMQKQGGSEDGDE